MYIINNLGSELRHWSRSFLSPLFPNLKERVVWNKLDSLKVTVVLRESYSEVFQNPRDYKVNLQPEGTNFWSVATLRANIALVQERQEMERSNRRILEEIAWKKLKIRSEEERVKEEIKHIQEDFKIKEELFESEVKIDVCTKLE